MFDARRVRTCAYIHNIDPVLLKHFLRYIPLAHNFPSNVERLRHLSQTGSRSILLSNIFCASLCPFAGNQNFINSSAKEGDKLSIWRQRSETVFTDHLVSVRRKIVLRLTSCYSFSFSCRSQSVPFHSSDHFPTGVCQQEKTTNGKGSYSWPRTVTTNTETVIIQCTANPVENAKRECRVSEQRVAWTKPDTSNCSFLSSDLAVIHSLAKVTSETNAAFFFIKDCTALSSSKSFLHKY